MLRNLSALVVPQKLRQEPRQVCGIAKLMGGVCRAEGALSESAKNFLGPRILAVLKKKKSWPKTPKIHNFRGSGKILKIVWGVFDPIKCLGKAVEETNIQTKFHQKNISVMFFGAMWCRKTRISPKTGTFRVFRKCNNDSQELPRVQQHARRAVKRRHKLLWCHRSPVL